MRNEVDVRCCSGWFMRIRRGSTGMLALLTILMPAAIRPVNVAAAEVLDERSMSADADRSDASSADPGLQALRRGAIDLVATYRTSAEDPCLVLRREAGAFHAAGDRPSIAMLVRSRQLGLWVVYFATAEEVTSPRSLADAADRMRWRTSRGVHAVAIDPDSPRVVEAAVSVWYARCPPASEGSLMAKPVRTEEIPESRRVAARRIAR